MPRHFSWDAPFPVRRGVEDFDRFASQGVATPGDLCAIDSLDLHARAVSPDDAPLAPWSVQRTQLPILSAGRLVLAAMADFFLLCMVCLLVVAILLAGRRSDTPPRLRQDRYLRIAKGQHGHSYRSALLLSRISPLPICVLPSRGGQNTQTMIPPDREGELL
jgi:hypothetical protein